MPSDSKANLITGVRQDIADLIVVIRNFRVHKLESDSVITFNAYANSDFVGANANITAAEFTQAVTDFNTCVNAILTGGTVGASVFANLMKLL